MRLIVLAAILSLFLIGGSRAHAQAGQPHVTVTITGPDTVAPGAKAAFDATVDVDGASSDIYLTWSGVGSPVPSESPCCKYVNSSVISGSANILGSIGTGVRITVQGPRAVLRLVLEVNQDPNAPQILVGAYLPGTAVAQYETISPWKSIVSSLPETGGRPPRDGSDAMAYVGAGLGLLLLSAAGAGSMWTRRSRQ